MDGSKQGKIKLLMFPWLAYGHISPFLELSKKLSERNFQIYFCSSPVNLSSIEAKLEDKYSFSIQFVELHLPSLPELPPHYHTTNGLPSHLMPTLKKAFDMASPKFSDILKTLRPDLLIYDFIQPWAPRLASLQNIPAVEFSSSSAAMYAFANYWVQNSTLKFPFSELYLREYEVENFGRLLNSSANNVPDKQRLSECMDGSDTIALRRTFREVEGKYIDYVSTISNKKMVPVGPLVQQDTESNEVEVMEVLQWLDKKDKRSTVFVSFGSEYFSSKEEIKDIALGLELSKVNFIWVIRFPVGEEINIEDALPEGYFKRVADRAMIVNGWAPQRRILGSSSIGGFVSHCGWGSVMESMTLGVPIIAMPMHLDQPLNARVVEEVGAGVEVIRDKNGKIMKEEMAKVIRQVVVEEAGDCVRKKAKEMKEILRSKGDEEIDQVMNELVQLVWKSEGNGIQEENGSE